MPDPTFEFSVVGSRLAAGGGIKVRDVAGLARHEGSMTSAR